MLKITVSGFLASKLRFNSNGSTLNTGVDSDDNYKVNMANHFKMTKSKNTV